MTTLQELRRTISRFVDERRQRRALQRELAQLAAMGSLDAVLADIGLTRSQIEPLVAGCSGSKELLDRMLARLGIDPARLPVETLRDMTWTCTTCPDKGKCREWLASLEEADFHAFCPNAAELDRAMAGPAQAEGRHSAPPATDGPDGGTYYPSVDDLRRMHVEASRREARALLDRANLL